MTRPLNQFTRTVRQVRRANYRIARELGDVDAVLHPSKLPKRVANKWLGRNLVRRIWR